MVIRSFFLLFIFLAALEVNVNAQPGDSVLSSLSTGKEMMAFIQGHAYENSIEKDFFKTDFELKLSDSSYEVVQFVVTWDDDEDNINELVVKGARVKVKKSDNGFKDIVPNRLLTFDHIVAIKGNWEYRLPALIINAVDSITAQYARLDFALCDALLEEHPDNSVLYSDFFSKDRFLNLSDSSYKLIDFDLVLKDPIENAQVSTKLKGNRIPVEKDEVTRLLKRLRPGATVSFENIQAEKNGKKYKVRALAIYIK